MSNFPKNLRYTKDHEWIAFDGKNAKVGISHYAQSQMGDIVFVDLPQEGQRLAAGDVLCVVESVKAVSDVYAPIAGEVVKVNSALEDRPELVNEEPYAQGWIVILETEADQQAEGLMDSEAYAALVEQEGGH